MLYKLCNFYEIKYILNFDVPNNFLTKKFQESSDGYVLFFFGQECFGGEGE